MKLRQMQCLCAVVDAQFNISRAATQLHATQPAVGKQLRQFEDEIGTELLLRHAGRPALTRCQPPVRVFHHGRPVAPRCVPQMLVLVPVLVAWGLATG